MSNLKDLCNIKFTLQKSTTAGNIFSGNGKTCLLKAVNREYMGKIKKPVYYLSLLEKNSAQYLSGLFTTADPQVLSGDYRDALGIKHIMLVSFAEAGKAMSLKAAA
jgi:hypothetical protein